MAHQQQIDFCQSVKQQLPQFFSNRFVIDIGSLDVNGNNRYLFEDCLYLGIDLFPGRNVDLATKGHELNLPDESIDVIISTECLEHDQFYHLTLQNSVRMLKPGGAFIMTCATTGRPEHGTRRTTPEDAPFIQDCGDWGDYYKNLDESAIRAVLNIDAIFETYGFSTNTESHDLYFWGIKKGTLTHRHDNASQSPHSNLHSLIHGLRLEIANLNADSVRRGEWALRLEAELKEDQKKLLKMSRSNSMRLTAPLRECRRWMTSPVQQVKYYVNGALRKSKRIYQRLPFSYQTKAAHRNFIARLFPNALLASGSQPITIPTFGIPDISTHSETYCEIEQLVSQCLDGTAKIEMPASDNPRISVIIPVYGQIKFTLRCLISITKNVPNAAFEVIVVDDCSPDNSVSILRAVQGINLICNATNQGFIRSCNIAAKKAKGEYLYFLNNDTDVTTGWLDELLRTFHELPGTGLAGSRLIYPGGRLQEAGGIIWQDGSAWNFGRYQDPRLPMYNYAREVDYCSGASIMVPKTLFAELGGFDEHYLPAYCEDADLALKIRDKGYRVIYQPLSTVVHHEGITSGTDTSQGTKAYQVVNTQKMFERWKSRLQTHQPSGLDVDNAKDRRATRRALVIDHCTPTPNQDAGSLVTYNLLLLLREMGFQVTFIPEDNFLYMPEYTTALQRAGIEMLYAPYVTSVNQHLKIHGSRYDLALLIRPAVVANHLKTIRKLCSKAKVLYLPADLHFLRMSREATLESDDVKQHAAEDMKQHELTVFSTVDASMVHSSVELDMIRTMLPDITLNLLPLIMDIKGCKKPFSERRDIVFVGGYQHTPNVDAVKYFVADIMPLLRKQLPGIRFHAVGSKAPAEIQALACQDVIITGFVEDLNALLNTMRIAIAPLRYGAGTKGKIASAMAVGLPVVASPLAAEGMFLEDGDNVLVADGAQAFADAITKLYQDEVVWNKISQNALALADKTWGKEAVWTQLASIIGDLGIEVTRELYPLSLYSGVDKIKMSVVNLD